MNEYFSLRLKHLREKHGLSQAELADKIGVSRGSISFYENNSRVPDIDVLCSLCDFFSVSSDYLLGRSDQVIPSYSSASALLGTGQNSLTPATKQSCAEFQSAFQQLYDTTTNIDEKYFPTTVECATELIDILTAIIKIFSNYKLGYSFASFASDIMEWYESIPEDRRDHLVSSSNTLKELLDKTQEYINVLNNNPVEKFSADAYTQIEKSSVKLGLFVLHLGVELSKLPNVPTISDPPEPPET